MLAVLLLVHLWRPRERTTIARRPPRGPDLLLEWRESPRLIRKALGCSPGTFDKLVNWICAHSALQDTQYMDLEEKVAIFLRILRSRDTLTDCEILFKRGQGTLSQWVEIEQSLFLANYK